jgi:hypothetical protein
LLSILIATQPDRHAGTGGSSAGFGFRLAVVLARGRGLAFVFNLFPVPKPAKQSVEELYRADRYRSCSSRRSGQPFRIHQSIGIGQENKSLTSVMTALSLMLALVEILAMETQWPRYAYGRFITVAIALSVPENRSYVSSRRLHPERVGHIGDENCRGWR